MHTPRYLALPVAFGLAACATEAGFDQRMNTLLGLSEVELVRAIGVPDAVHPPEAALGPSRGGERRFLQYESLGLPAPAPAQPRVGFGVGGGGMFGGFGRGVGVGVGVGFSGPASAPPPSRCSVTFELLAGRVATFARRGDACIAEPP